MGHLAADTASQAHREGVICSIAVLAEQRHLHDALGPVTLALRVPPLRAMVVV